MPGLDKLASRYANAAAHLRNKRNFGVASDIIAQRSSRRPRAVSTVTAWLRNASEGVCAHYFADGLGRQRRETSARTTGRSARTGRCEGRSGNFAVTQAENNLTSYAGECLRMCAACGRCNFLTLSRRERTCHWFESCGSLQRLRLAVTGPATLPKQAGAL